MNYAVAEAAVVGEEEEEEEEEDVMAVDVGLLLAL